MPFKKGEVTNPKGGKIGHRGGTGRPLNSIREMCREIVFNDRLVERLARFARGEGVRDYVAEDGKIYKDAIPAKVNEQIEAAQILIDRGFGRPEQSLDITQHDDSDKPSTDVLIQTITALRTELDHLRKGAGMEAAK